jgi:hypothetical protein
MKARKIVKQMKTSAPRFSGSGPFSETGRWCPFTILPVPVKLIYVAGLQISGGRSSKNQDFPVTLNPLNPNISNFRRLLKWYCQLVPVDIQQLPGRDHGSNKAQYNIREPSATGAVLLIVVIGVN